MKVEPPPEAPKGPRKVVKAYNDLRKYIMGRQFADVDGDVTSKSITTTPSGRLVSWKMGVAPSGGACCIDGVCSIKSYAECIAAGGTYQGDGTTCDGIDCTLGACCNFDGSCDDVPDYLCGDCTIGVSSCFLGYGTSCATSRCIGACCCFGGGAGVGWLLHGTCAMLGCDSGGVCLGESMTYDECQRACFCRTANISLSVVGILCTNCGGGASSTSEFHFGYPGGVSVGSFEFCCDEHHFTGTNSVGGDGATLSYYVDIVPDGAGSLTISWGGTISNSCGSADFAYTESGVTCTGGFSASHNDNICTDCIDCTDSDPDHPCSSGYCGHPFGCCDHTLLFGLGSPFGLAIILS